MVTESTWGNFLAKMPWALPCTSETPTGYETSELAVKYPDYLVSLGRPHFRHASAWMMQAIPPAAPQPVLSQCSSLLSCHTASLSHRLSHAGLAGRLFALSGNSVMAQAPVGMVFCGATDPSSHLTQ